MASQRFPRAREPLADPRLAGVLVSTARLKRRLRTLAGEIAAAEPAGGGGGLLLLGVLNGAFIFCADLARELRRAGLAGVSYGFIKTSAYGDSLKNGTAPAVRLDYAPEGLRGRRILLVEDLLDQGATLRFLKQELTGRLGVAELRICVLLRKRLAGAAHQAQSETAPDFVGFEIPDRWVVGYGLDAAGQYRDLPFIAAVHEEYFR